MARAQRQQIARQPKSGISGTLFPTRIPNHSPSAPWQACTACSPLQEHDLHLQGALNFLKAFNTLVVGGH